MKKIHKAVLQPLLNTTWKTRDSNVKMFEFALGRHSEKDALEGCTARYTLRKGTEGSTELTFDELKNIVSSGAIDSSFYHAAPGLLEINQHYLHSLEEFYSKCQKAWGEHIAQTNKLKGTASGRCRFSQITNPSDQ